MSANIAVSLSSTKIEVTAGGSVEATITIANQGQIVDHFAVNVEGIDPTWWTLSTSSLSLFPGDEDQVKLTLHPPKDAEAKAGSYSFNIKATSRANPREETTQMAYLILGGFTIWEVDMLPTKVVGQRGTYRITVNNSGNSDINLVFEGRDPEESLLYNFSKSKITVPAGDKIQIQLTAHPEKGQKGKLYSFQILVRPEDAKSLSKDTKVLNGQLEYSRRNKLWWWLIPLIILLLIVSVLIIRGCPRGNFEDPMDTVPLVPAQPENMKIIEPES